MNSIQKIMILFLLTTFSLSALDTIDINTCNPNCVIGKNLEILEDKTNLLTIEEIRQDVGIGWNRSESDKPNFGYSSSSYWVRFQVENKKDKPVRYFLELDYPMLDYAHFYY